MQDDWKESDQCDASSDDNDGEIHWFNDKGIGIGLQPIQQINTPIDLFEHINRTCKKDTLYSKCAVQKYKNMASM